ncbi:MAG: hypothetical protein LLF97_12705 [Planctomycetaceae bacterium]|nr:hypothetical protein [Planctomycetaceae bacterium]
MNDPRRSEELRKLTSRLQREAADSRPPFSEALHRRMVDAIEPHRAAPVRRVRRSPLRGALVAAAAACLLAVILPSYSTQEPQPHPNATNAMTAVQRPVDSTAVAEWSLWADDAMNELDWPLVSQAVAVPSDQLKHDTRVAVETVLSRLPINVEWPVE